MRLQSSELTGPVTRNKCTFRETTPDERRQ